MTSMICHSRESGNPAASGIELVSQRMLTLIWRLFLIHMPRERAALDSRLCGKDAQGGGLRLFITSILAFLITFPAFAADMPVPALSSSLFFSDEEVAKIDAEVRRAPRPLNRDAVSLGAILYFGPNRWTVWIRGERYTPETDSPSLRILSVTPESVRIALNSHDNSPGREITLRPHQTFHIASGEVTQGLE